MRLEARDKLPGPKPNFQGSKFKVRRVGNRRSNEAVGPITVRLGPLGTAWYRINFFLRTFRSGTVPEFACGSGLQRYNPWGWAASASALLWRTSWAAWGRLSGKAVSALTSVRAYLRKRLLSGRRWD